MLGVRSQIFLKTFKVYVDFNFVQWGKEGNLDKAIFKNVNCRLLTNIPYQREERRGKCPKPFWPGLQFLVKMFGQMQNMIDPREVSWARETEQPLQTLVFTKVAGHKTSPGSMLHCYNQTFGTPSLLHLICAVSSYLPPLDSVGCHK